LCAALAAVAGCTAPATFLAAPGHGVATRSADGLADHPRVIRWRPCGGNPAVDCGGLTLPIDWAHPNGATFTVALARRKATNPADRIGSLIVDPGGPGGSGVAMVEYKDPFPAQLRARFDIVGFDPRGSGASDPISCDATVLAATPAADPATPAGFAALARYNQRLAADCLHRSGPMFGHADDLSVVRDIDAIRTALGDQKLTFYGVSYGTLMGQQYAEMYPSHVRALALDSNEDHSLPGTTVGISAAASAEDSFTQFTQWCRAAAACALHGRDTATLFDQLYDRALTGRLTMPGQPRQRLSPADLISLTEDDLLAPDWPGLATALAAAATAPPAPAVLPPPAAFPEKADAYTMAAVCADWSVSLAPAGHVSAAQQVATQLRRMTAAAPHMRLDARSWQSVLACLGRSGTLTNPPHPYHVQRGVPPILMVNSLHDPATPYAWALDVARQIRQATLVTYDGWGHGVYRQSSCAQQIIDNYLINLRIPPRGTHCLAIRPGKTT
jgi:pimeloyl-ACP methyl ester carboxylesterase